MNEKSNPDSKAPDSKAASNSIEQEKVIPAELERYSRQIRFPGIGLEGQQRLRGINGSDCGLRRARQRDRQHLGSRWCWAFANR